MSSTFRPAYLWRTFPKNSRQRLRRCLDQAAPESAAGDKAIVFFRADDVGAPGSRFNKLVGLFLSHRLPLTMAVVPAWLTGPRWQSICELCGSSNELWGWAQHGWRHSNHERLAKNHEFGPSRSMSQKRRDLQLGFERLRTFMGEDLLPVFSPPWNRCDQETLNAIEDLGYRAISRSQFAQPVAPPTLPDYAVSVDLHTRKEGDSESGWQSLFAELHQSLKNGFCGIMIHHQRMNSAAFEFLEILLSELKQWNHARLVHLGNLIDEEYRV